MTSPIADNQELQEYLGHLRKVHFTLVLVSFAILVAAFLGRSDEAERALQQLRQIQNVVEQWDSMLFNRRAAWIVQAERAQWLSRTWTIAGQPGVPTIEVVPSDTPDPLWTLEPTWAFQPLREDFRTLDDPARRWVIDKPETLGEFVQMWNGFAQHHVRVYMPGEPTTQAVVSSPASLAVLVPLTEGSSQRNDAQVVHVSFDPISGDRRKAVSSTSQVDTTSHAFVGSLADDFRVIIPVETIVDSINGQVALRDHYRVSWGLGPFHESFSALSDFASPYAELSFARLDQVLRDVAEQAEDRVVIFGSAIPVSQLAAWGVVVVLALQVYFLLHLLGFRVLGVQRVGHVAWVGTYATGGAKLVTAATTCFAPIAVLLVLFVRGYAGGASAAVIFLLAVAVLVSGWLASRTLWELRQLWKIVGGDEQVWTFVGCKQDMAIFSSEDEVEVQLPRSIFPGHAVSGCTLRLRCLSRGDQVVVVGWLLRLLR